MSKERVLIVEDDESILGGLRLNLELEGYSIVVAKDGKEAVEQFEEHEPDLVILDVMLPEMNGFEVLESIRRRNPDVPVMMLSAKDTQADKIAGLKIGADDYVTKPFALPELLARINAALRRNRLKLGPAPGMITFGDVEIDTEGRKALKNGVALELTTKEYDLLVYLARGRDRVMTREQILQRVWGEDYEGTARTVDNFILRLRQKVEDDPLNPAHIQTVRGVGYRFST